MYKVIIKTTNGETTVAEFRDEDAAMALYNNERMKYDACAMEPLVIRADNIREMKLNPQNIVTVEFEDDTDMHYLKNHDYNCISDLPPRDECRIKDIRTRHTYRTSDDIPEMDDGIVEALLSRLIEERGIHIDELAMCTALMLEVPYPDLFVGPWEKPFEEHGAWWLENKKVLSELQAAGLVYGVEGTYTITLAGARFYIKCDKYTLEAVKEYGKKGKD